jgi:RND family efflux transporter MFP subunit
MDGYFNRPDRATASTDAAARRRRRALGWIGAGTLALLLAASGVLVREMRPGATASLAPAASTAAPPVTVGAPVARRLASWASFLGQFSAVDNVEIRAQVSGYLTEIHFTDGQIVRKGDLLFVIDPRPFQIQLEQANAQLATATAQLELANRELARSTALRRSEVVSEDLQDQRVQQQHAAQAALDAAKAAVRSAELNLEFSHITAPLTGRISMHRVSIGGLVSGGASASTLLTTIVSLDPIHLDFDMSEADYLAYQRFHAQPSAAGPGDAVIEANLSDEQGWQRHGTLDFLDNALDRGSGTMQARATLPNPDFFIAPGEFARLRLPLSSPRDVLLVPDAAIVTDQSRKLVMTVAPDGTVVPKTVEIGALDQGLRVITSGLAADDKVVINGLMRAQPGAKVSAQPGSIAPQS